MSREVVIKLGLDGAFATRRWEQPENVIRITKELGFNIHEYCCDQIDPLFMGPEDFVLQLAERIRKAAQHYEVEIFDTYTGVSTHRYHSFSHSQPEPGQRMKQWLEAVMDLTVALGARRWGGHVDALPVEVLEDPEETRRRIARLYATWRELAVIAKEKGLTAIYVEQMYVPSEVPWTLQQSEEFLLACNADSDGVPIYLTVDVGHQAGQQYGMSGPDLDYLEWIRRFAAFSEVIHLQQTTPEASAHWPFTAEYNQKGKVEMAELMEAVSYAHAHCESSPVSQVLEPVSCNMLMLEVIPASTKSEENLLEELSESHDYLRQFVPKGGITLTV